MQAGLGVVTLRDLATRRRRDVVDPVALAEEAAQRPSDPATRLDVPAILKHAQAGLRGGTGPSEGVQGRRR